MFFSPPNPTFSTWQDKSVWIIGASSGIGAACAQLLAKNQAQLILTARNLSKLNEVSQQCASYTNRAPLVIEGDITELKSMEAAYEEVKRCVGHIDLVIIASGKYDALSAVTLTPQDLPLIKDTLDTNLMGYYSVLSQILPDFIHRQRGSIAFISSVAGFSGLPNALAYAPSKAALNNLAEGLYCELHPQHIGIHIVCPGFVSTPMTAQNRFPMPALISPEEAAKAIIRGIERGQFEIHFPKRFTLFLQLLRRFPRALYVRLTAYFFKHNVNL